jgi:hypothetical protein
MFPPNVFTLAATATFVVGTALFTTHIPTDAGRMPASKRVCPHCGILVSVGWGWQSHLKTHVDDGDNVGDSDGHMDSEDSDDVAYSSSNAEDEYGSEEVGEDPGRLLDVPGAFDDRPGQQTVSDYLDTLSAEGRLRPQHVLQYMLWGKRRSTTEGTLKTFLFLRAMYGGTGASRRQGQEMLDFVHSMGAIPAGMPRQIKHCWSLVTKVNHKCLRNI